MKNRGFERQLVLFEETLPLRFLVTEFSGLLNKLLRLGIEFWISSILPKRAKARDKTDNNYEKNGKIRQGQNPIAPYLVLECKKWKKGSWITHNLSDWGHAKKVFSAKKSADGSMPEHERDLSQPLSDSFMLFPVCSGIIPLFSLAVSDVNQNRQDPLVFLEKEMQEFAISVPE